MVQALPKTEKLTFDEFAQWKPEGDSMNYMTG